MDESAKGAIINKMQEVFMAITIKRAARAAIGLPALLALALIGTGCPTDGGSWEH
ncbi:MAG: hypothetical protein LBC88_03135 [Spirochaetaceae bacterium]|nr:hypothetical protein [Spirochaetaceae bacterium]